MLKKTIQYTDAINAKGSAKGIEVTYALFGLVIYRKAVDLDIACSFGITV